MKTKCGKWIVAVGFVFLILLFTACSKNETAGAGEAEIQITDAPTDDASIKSVFVTVTAIRVDGMAVSGFAKQTIDLKAYQDGNIKSLGTTNLTSGVHGQLTFVLDADTDADGNSPGSYVQTTDNTKYKLGSGSVAITVAKAWNIAANVKSTLVADFDLRKSVQWSSDNAVRYMFVSDGSLQAAVRVVDKMNAGTLSGTYTEQNSTNADKVIVYVYKKGTFNAGTETQAQGVDAIYFKNAVSSAEVKGLVSKYYTLAYLEEGDYELHFAAYAKDSTTGRFILQNMLSAQLSVNGSIADFVTVSSKATLTVASSVNL
ncbi:MAG TPA: DUF4382 domain-containing protein [Cyclobacteriaceae bacterium]|nr:DUF4382 domain-containing protein [Cyclobacteriaceae bacterium]